MARNCTSERHSHHPTPHRSRLSQKRPRIDFEPQCGPAYQRFIPITAYVVQPLTVLSHESSGSGDRVRSRRVHPIQLRQHAMTDAIARVVDVVVRLVLHPALTARVEEGAQIQSRHVEERPDHITALRVNAGQSRQPGAAYELQQEGLGLIVPGMPNRDAIGAYRCRRPMQELVAQSTRRVLNRQSLCRSVSGDVDRFDFDRKSARIAERPAERFIAIRCRSEPMIQMREADNSKAAVLAQLAENQRERNRIRPPGQTNQYAASRWTEPVTLDRAANLLKESGHSMPNAQCPMLKETEPLPRAILGIGPWACALVCRRADSNRRPRAYETRALTD
jgi:hypothetical protein